MFDGCVQKDFLNSQHIFIRHGLIGLHLGEVVARLICDECAGSLADVDYRRNANGSTGLCVHEGSGGFAVIFHAQGAMTDGAVCRGGESVCETAVCFGDDEQPLRALIRFQLQ